MLHFCLLFKVPEIINEYYHNNRYPTILCAVYITVIPSFVHISPTTSLVVYAKFFCLTVTASWPNRLPCSVRCKSGRKMFWLTFKLPLWFLFLNTVRKLFLLSLHTWPYKAVSEPAHDVKPCFFLSHFAYDICPTRVGVEFLMCDTTRARVMPVESD